jgi:hypothetical protein
MTLCQGFSGSEIWFRDFRSLSRKGSGVPLDRVGLLGAFLSRSPRNGPNLVRVHANFFLCASHSAMTCGAQWFIQNGDLSLHCCSTVGLTLPDHTHHI